MSKILDDEINWSEKLLNRDINFQSIAAGLLFGLSIESLFQTIGSLVQGLLFQFGVYGMVHTFFNTASSILLTLLIVWWVFASIRWRVYQRRFAAPQLLGLAIGTYLLLFLLQFGSTFAIRHREDYLPHFQKHLELQAHFAAFAPFVSTIGYLIVIALSVWIISRLGRASS